VKGAIAADAESDPTDLPAARARQRWLRRVLVLVAAVAFVFSTLSTGFISGNGAFWERPGGDVGTGLIGWINYAHDDWRWPIFAIRNYHYPEGANVYLADALPLFALPAKVIYKTTGWLPIYIGFWVALCLFLQAVCASRLLSAIGVRSLLPHLAGVLLFCYVPALFLRFGHMTLMAHFFILAELELYVRSRREVLTPRQWFWVCALPVIAILVQPYLAVMAVVLALVIVGDRWRANVLSLRQVLVRVGAIVLAAVLVAVCGGFIFTKTRPHYDWGVYSTNLMSPLVPFADTWLGAHLGTASPTIPGIWQWEGAAYFGAGAWFLIVCCFPFWRDAPAALRRHATLMLGVLPLLLYAISNRVGFANHELLHVPLPQWLIGAFSTLRTGGRMFWLTMYVCFAAAIACVVKRYQPGAAASLLVIAGVLQWIDVQPMQPSRRGVSAAGAAPTIDETRWRALIAAHARIFQFPSFQCGGIYNEDIENSSIYRELEIDLIAARLDRPTNSAYLARYTKDCERERERAGRDTAEPGTLYLYRSSEDIGAYLAEHGQDVRRCGVLDDVVVCSASTDLSIPRGAN
jgi:hypothetical protein